MSDFKRNAELIGQPWNNVATALNEGEIEFNEEFSKALQLMEGTDRNLVVTGRAGTGKSTLLSYFISKTSKAAAVLAPTGVAAVNVGGQTIHSFFGFRPDVTLPKVKRGWGERAALFQELDALVVDEASMIRADLLDCVDKFLRLNRREKSTPFGGLQMIFFGDLYQLPPVVTGREKELFEGHYASPYFFDSRSFNDAGFEIVELEKVYRQKDDSFIRLLNSIRNKTAQEAELRALNNRCLSSPSPAQGEFCVTLTTTNDLADAVNERKLSSIKKPVREYAAVVKGEVGKEYFPAKQLVRLKEGSQVMLLNNDSGGRWVNGTVGVVEGFRPGGEEEVVRVRLQHGPVAEVTPHTWSVFEYFYDPGKNALNSRTIGSFRQYPLNLAWAVTIHKSQGKTFDRVHVDIGRGTFTPGQLYVALSRCRTLEGITLEKQVEKKNFYADWRVVKFVTNYQYARSEQQAPLEQKIALVQQAIEAKMPLEIVYLKANDVKSRRIVQPLEVGEMEYLGKKYLGLRGYCFQRRDERTFRLDRVLEIAAARTKTQ